MFDLGDTLWTRTDDATWNQLEAAANQCTGALLHRYIASGLLPPGDDQALGSRLRSALNDYIGEQKRWNPELEINGALAIARILRQWGVNSSDGALATQIFNALDVRVPASRPLFGDALPTLAALQARGFLLGIVTNRPFGGEPFQEDLRTIGLLDYFDVRHMAISADLGVRKPNPALFLHTLHALNVSPAEAVMVGDSLNEDVLGAQRTGIFATWKMTPKQLAQIKAYLRRDTITPLRDWPPFAMPSLHETMEISADLQNRAASLERYLRGELRPDLVIQHPADLLDVFEKAGVQ